MHICARVQNKGTVISQRWDKREDLNIKTRYVLSLTCESKMDTPSQAALPGSWCYTGMPRLCHVSLSLEACSGEGALAAGRWDTLL